jgi:hypothetical protein
VAVRVIQTQTAQAGQVAVATARQVVLVALELQIVAAAVAV